MAVNTRTVSELREFSERTAATRQVMVVNGAPAVVQEIGPPPFDETVHPWERQPDENDYAWEAFKTYLMLPANNRTVTQLEETRSGKHVNNVALAKHRIYWRWDERVMLYNRHVETVIMKELQEREVKARLAAADLGRSLRKKAAEAASVLRTIAYESKVIEDEDGNKKMVRVPKSALTANEIVRLAQVGVELERAALGGADAQPQGPQNVMNLIQVMNVDIEDSEALELASEIIRQREADVIDVDSAGRSDVAGA